MTEATPCPRCNSAIPPGADACPVCGFSLSGQAPHGTPSRVPLAVISMHHWSGLCAGGESGYTAPDPLHPDILFGGTVIPQAIFGW